VNRGAFNRTSEIKGARVEPVEVQAVEGIVHLVPRVGSLGGSSLDAAVTSYLTSKYFTELAPGTQRMRRNLLKNICAEVRRLSAAEISEARNEIPSETPARSAPWRPVHQRQNWRTA
jgi:hypothetical protein